MRRIIAVANHKGGVGKTTSVASLASALANMGNNVLMVDLDPQANLTTSFLKDAEVDKTIYDVMKEDDSAPLPTVKVRENLSIVPSCLDMAAIEIDLSNKWNRELILKNHIYETGEGLGNEGDYDYILLDCPPSLGLITVSAFAAADYVLVPVTAEALPFSGLTMIENIISSVTRNMNENLKFLGVFITRWEGRNLNKMVEEGIRKTYGEKLLSTKIRTNIAIAEAQLAKEDIITYNKSSRGAKDYETLALEISDIIYNNEWGKDE